MLFLMRVHFRMSLKCVVVYYWMFWQKSSTFYRLVLNELLKSLSLHEREVHRTEHSMLMRNTDLVKFAHHE